VLKLLTARIALPVARRLTKNVVAENKIKTKSVHGKFRAPIFALFICF